MTLQDNTNKIPVISIIVPCYNQGIFLADALNSVIKQTFKNWECIIIDDGSSDNTKTISKDFCDKDSRFTYIYQENNGVSSARNNAISHAKGEYILPLDADDMIAETYIEKALTAFKNNPELKLVYCRVKLFGTLNNEWVIPEYSFNELLWRNIIFCSAVYKKSDFDKTKGYNTTLQGFEDWDFWLSFLKPTDSVLKLDEILFFYRIKEKSRNNEASQKLLYLYNCIYKNHEDLYKPFLQDIIHYHNDSEQYINILNSLSYKIGHFLLAPVRFIKKIF